MKNGRCFTKLSGMCNAYFHVTAGKNGRGQMSNRREICPISRRIGRTQNTLTAAELDVLKVA